MAARKIVSLTAHHSVLGGADLRGHGDGVRWDDDSEEMNRLIDEWFREGASPDFMIDR
jgi:hypothetical protein